MVEGLTTKGSYTTGDARGLNEKVFDEMIKKRLRKEIQECEAIGLQLDETSDIQNKERFVIIAKLVKKGKVLTRLLDLF